MLEHCDFREQVSENVEGGRLRPDMIIHLPGEIQVVVDAKVPLAAFLEAIEATDDLTRAQKLKDHVRQLRTHIGALSAKSYWENFQPSPDFVILFLPGEAFYNAALEQDPELVETAIGQRVMIATPMSLITLLPTRWLSAGGSKASPTMPRKSAIWARCCTIGWRRSATI